MPVLSIAYSPDSKLVAASHFTAYSYDTRSSSAGVSGELRIWDVESQEYLLSISLDGLTLQPICWTPDSGHVTFLTTLSTYQDMTSNAEKEDVLAWNVKESRLERHYVGSASAISPDRRLIARNVTESQVAIVDLKNTRQADLILDGTPHRAVRFSADSSRVATLAGEYLKHEHEIVIWDIKRGKPNCRFPVRLHSRPFFEFSADGSLFAAASLDEAVLRVRSTRNGKLIRSFDTGTSDIWGIAISSDSKRIAVCTEGAAEKQDGTVKVWDIPKGKLLTEIVDKEVWGGTAVAFSPDGRTLATGSPTGEIKFFDVPSDEPPKE